MLKPDPLANRSGDEGNETDEAPESVAAPETQEPAMEESTAGAASEGPGPVYIDRQQFVAIASAAMGEDLSNESTQALQELYDFRNAYEMPPLATSSRNSSVRVAFFIRFNVLTQATHRSSCWRARR